MRTIVMLALALLVMGAGCTSVDRTTMPTAVTNEPVRATSDDRVSGDDVKVGERAPKPPSEVVLPLDGQIVGYLPTYKRFGEYVEDRFRGYHVGEDSEVPPEDLGPGEVQEVPVRAIADGVVRHVDWVAGYGGVMVIAHEVGGDRVNAIYGHLNLSTAALRKGSPVNRGQHLANLGDDRSRETDGERQHLHFALYTGDELRLQGYERSSAAVATWVNPQDFFARYDVAESLPQTTYRSLDDPQGKRIFALDFAVPHGWDVEYIPSLQALNLYRVHGAGTARERSQVLMRSFDASRFLTLSTVTIHETEDRRIGVGDYVARRYDIEKKSGVPDFPDQPSWRNERHIVTDFRAKDGFTRYYVVAANPNLDRAVYEQLLESMRIIE